MDVAKMVDFCCQVPSLRKVAKCFVDGAFGYSGVLIESGMETIQISLGIEGGIDSLSTGVAVFKLDGSAMADRLPPLLPK
ncbi:MAG: hypothetical protein C0478_01690 [Planctomyces sp.]|nr:hypothetical protein [Planctomyces sp.]